jgi:putative nucleotidyltransferase with HDIG domain
MLQLIRALRDPPEVLRQLRDVEGLWLVGGWLRDAWWGRPTRDIDLAAEGPLAAALDAIEARLGKRPFLLNERFASHRLVQDDYELDISPLHPDGITADLARRDFTINAWALPLSFLGDSDVPDMLFSVKLGARDCLKDLGKRRLRMVDRANLADDPLRVLRGFRLLATREMNLEDGTRQALAELAPRIGESAPERIHEELLLWFGAERDITDSVAQAAECGVVWQLFPELEATRGCAQNDYHHLDVWEHTLLCLGELHQLLWAPPAELAQWRAEFQTAWETQLGGEATMGALTRLALLLHDIGKPPTSQRQPDGHISFLEHQTVGAELVAPYLLRLKFSTEEAKFILLMIREHLRLGFYSDYLPLSPRLVYRYVRRLGTATPLAVLHSLADCAAALGPRNTGAMAAHVQAAAEILAHYYAQDEVAAPPVLLDGHAIMALLGIGPGPLVGELKDALLEATAAGEVESVAEAEALVRQLYAKRDQS